MNRDDGIDGDVGGSPAADRNGGVGRDESPVRVGGLAHVRSKNAGPFRLTIDVFCENGDAYAAIVDRLPTRRVADALGVDERALERYVLPALDVVKFSLPRPVVQGAPEDRDLHGAQWAVLVEGLALD